MKPSLERTLKLLWLAIGALLLLCLAAAGVMVLWQVIGNAGAGREAARVAGEAEPAAQEPQPVRYGMPDSIRGTATRIAVVHRGGPAYSSGRESYESSGGRSGEANVIFLDGNGVRLLLDRPAYIREISYPRPADTDAPRAWISYVLALDDTDRSGTLDGRDRPALYVTDLEGHNLRAVIRPPLRYLGHEALGPTRILVYALQEGENARMDEYRMRQRAFIYDVASGRLSPYAALDSAAARAGQILRR